MSDLRERYIESLIENVREGALDVELLDRIERLLAIEHGVTAPDFVQPSEPPPPDEEPQEREEVAERSARPATAEQPVASPAPSPGHPILHVHHEEPEQAPATATSPALDAAVVLASDQPAQASPFRKRRGRPAAPMPRCQDCGRELTNRTATRCRACSNKSRMGTRSPRTSQTMTEVWEERRAVSAKEVPLCIDGCGNTVSKTGGRCRTCAGILRQKPIVKKLCTCASPRAFLAHGDWHEEDCPYYWTAPEPVTVHVSPVASPETLEAIGQVARKAIEALAEGKIGLTEEQKLENLLACSCSADAIEDAGTAWKPESAGPWHSITCSLWRGPDPAPAVEIANAAAATPGVCHCGLPLVYYREREGDEWRCFNGHVSYGVGFKPFDYELNDAENPRARLRQPSHNGRSL